MKAISIIDKDSILINRKYEQIKELFKSCHIESVEKASGRIYDNIKDKYIVKNGDVLTIEGRPSELFKIGIYKVA